jgi:endonuclease/exonuclease/phosphatase family metal-dependent hydrolase
MLPLADVTRSSDCRQVSSQTPSHVTVTWILPDAPEQRAKLDAACAGIGPVVVQTASGGSLSSPLPLTIVVWNTFLGRGNVDELVSKLELGDFTGGQRIDRFALVLQEVFRTPILEFARRRGLSIVYAPARRRGNDADDRGNAILATAPLDQITVVELPFEKQRRIAVGARLGALQIVNVHFDTSVGLFRGGPSAARRRQARAVSEALAGIPEPLIIAGDLNTWWGDDEPAVKALRQVFPDAEPIAARETWRGPLRAGNKLDYLFAKGIQPPVAVRRLNERFGSDHWPLLATVPLP